MTRRLLFALLLGIGIAASSASADTMSYTVLVNTPDFGGPGWIDFSFSQANAAGSLSATASITGFQHSGYTLDGSPLTSPGVTGALNAPPLQIPNDAAGVNFFTQHVAGWGSSFSFIVTLSGPAVGAPASDGSAFRLTLFDEAFTPFVSPLDGGEVANILINTDGSLTPSGSVFAGGGATVAPASTAVPEPGTASLVLSVAALSGLLFRRRK